MKREQRLVVALDCSYDLAADLQHKLSGLDVGWKVGYHLLLDSKGHARIMTLINSGHRVMLDLKLHDHPTTVMTVARLAADMGFWACTVHGQDRRTLDAARIGRDHIRASHMKLLAVTVLSSNTDGDLEEQSVFDNHSPYIGDVVSFRTKKALAAGFDGVMCPAAHASAARHVFRERGTPEHLVVCPGVRVSYVKGHDQHAETVHPHFAISNGASHIVVGRPITGADDPAIAALDYINEMAGPEQTK